MNDRASEIEAVLSTQRDELRKAARQYGAVTRDRIAEGCERIKEYTVKEPARALGIALGVGQRR